MWKTSKALIASGIVTFICIMILIIPAIAGCIAEWNRRAETYAILRRVAENPEIARDVWGTTIHIDTVQGAINVTTAVSAGPDRIFHTPDDLSVENRDLNALKIGEKVGKTSARTALGVLQGGAEGLNEEGVDSQKAGETTGEVSGKFYRGFLDKFKGDK